MALNDFSQMRQILDKFNAIGKFLPYCQGQQAPSEKQRRAIVNSVSDSLKLDQELIKGFGVLFDAF